jgi:predicted ribosome quality control (RQC) complex YloA/Tae2 family protein
MNLDGFFFNCLVAELKEQLAGSRVEDIYDTQGGNLIIQFRAPGRTLRLEVSVRSGPFCFYLTNQGKGSKGAGVFSQTLKKHLAGQFCVSVTNRPFDRLATLTFAPDLESPGQFFAHIELMGRQNDLILCQGDIITATTRSPRRDSSRPLQPGDRYTYPPGAGKVDPVKASAALLQTLFSNMGPITAEKALVKGIFGVSPLLARELCDRAELKPNCPVQEVDITVLESLSAQIYSLSRATLEGKVCPVVYEQGLTQPGPYWIVLTHIAQVPREFPSLSEALEYWTYSSRSSKEFNDLSSRLQGAIQSATSKLQRTMAKQQLELERADSHDIFRQIGDTLLARILTIPRGAKSVTMDNVHTGTPLVIDLDPEKSPSSNAASYYKKYNKYKNALAKVKKHMKANQTLLEYLDSLEYTIESSENPGDLREVMAEMADQGIIKPKTKAKARAKALPQEDYLRYTSPQGETILVGKNNRQNEILTLRKADKEHYWLHTRHFPGSHVILCSPNPDDSSLEYAAALAAWHSKARLSPKVEVVWTQVKNVKKIPGGKPGMVNYYEYRSAAIDPRLHLGGEERQ